MLLQMPSGLLYDTEQIGEYHSHIRNKQAKMPVGLHLDALLYDDMQYILPGNIGQKHLIGIGELCRHFGELEPDSGANGLLQDCKAYWPTRISLKALSRTELGQSAIAISCYQQIVSGPSRGIGQCRSLGRLLDEIRSDLAKHTNGIQLAHMLGLCSANFEQELYAVLCYSMLCIAEYSLKQQRIMPIGIKSDELADHAYKLHKIGDTMLFVHGNASYGQIEPKVPIGLQNLLQALQFCTAICTYDELKAEADIQYIVRQLGNLQYIAFNRHTEAIRRAIMQDWADRDTPNLHPWLGIKNVSEHELENAISLAYACAENANLHSTLCIIFAQLVDDNANEQTTAFAMRKSLQLHDQYKGLVNRLHLP